MSRFFDRGYKLTVFDESGNATIFTKLRINFEVIKSTISYPNLARVSIYNISNDELAKIAGRYNRITLELGYDGDTALVFRGEIRNVLPDANDGVDTVTTIYAGDGQSDWDNSTINKTFSDKITLSTLISELGGTFSNISIGNIEDVPNRTYTGGQTLSGTSREILDRITRENNLTWNIQDEELLIYNSDSSSSIIDAQVVSPQSGLLGVPTITEIGADFVSLLNHRIKPNGLVVIESSASSVAIANLQLRNIPRISAEGTYKVQEATFKGDTIEGTFTVSCKCIAI